MELTTKNALFLQILSANRPFNTVSVKWSYIDFEKGTWSIPASEMKNRKSHIIPLSSYMVVILKAQRELLGSSEYVFKNKYNPKAHISLNTISKAIRTTFCDGKWHNKVVPYGFRSTFKTICTLNLARLYQMDISEKVVEEIMDHSTKGMAAHYERAKATLDQKARLMQWYGDYLNDLEPLF